MNIQTWASFMTIRSVLFVSPIWQHWSKLYRRCLHLLTTMWAGHLHLVWSIWSHLSVFCVFRHLHQHELFLIQMRYPDKCGSQVETGFDSRSVSDSAAISWWTFPYFTWNQKKTDFTFSDDSEWSSLETSKAFLMCVCSIMPLNH